MAKRSKDNNTPPAPPRVRAKTDMSHKSEDEKLKVSERYLAAHPQSPVAAEVKAEAEDLTKKRATLVEKIEAQKAAHQAADSADVAVLAASQDHEVASAIYARAVAYHGNGDPGVLVASAVERAAARKRHVAIPEKVTGLAVERGRETGSSMASYDRPFGAVSFAIQYKLEPSTDADPWLPKDGPFQTRKTEYTIEGLPADADLRVHVRGIGDYPGPWSDPKIGKAR